MAQAEEYYIVVHNCSDLQQITNNGQQIYIYINICQYCPSYTEAISHERPWFTVVLAVLQNIGINIKCNNLLKTNHHFLLLQSYIIPQDKKCTICKCLPSNTGYHAANQNFNLDAINVTIAPLMAIAICAIVDVWENRVCTTH